MADKFNLILCPYCGGRQKPGDRCVLCNGLLDELSRIATQISMGPWYVRDTDKPFHPGCDFLTLKKWIQSGKVGRKTVIRGPTTNQFWNVVKRVRGVSHLVGSCHACRAKVNPTDTFCPQCGVSFLYEPDRDKLGLEYPTEHDVAVARQQLKQPRRQPAPHVDAAGPTKTPSRLLDDVLVAQGPGADHARPDTPLTSPQAASALDEPVQTDAPATAAPSNDHDTEDLPAHRKLSSPMIIMLAVLNLAALSALIYWVLQNR